MNLRRALPELSTRGAQVKILKRASGLEILVKGADKTQVAEVKLAALEAKQQAEQNYLEKAYYIKYQDGFGYTAIKPDHMRFAYESLPLISPIAQHIFDNYKNLPTRNIVSLLLSWVQSIPYSELEDRRSSHGAGFSPPNRLLMENQGDCDSKSVLLLSVLRSLFPKVGLILILVPNHALVGIQIPYQQDDDYIELDGNYYVLAEPTGPAILPLAKMGDTSRPYIAGKNFTYEIVPLR